MNHDDSTIVNVTCDQVTSILHFSMSVDRFQYDSVMMEHPEYHISIRLVFCAQSTGPLQHLETKWNVYRTFHEFELLDHQLRSRFPPTKYAMQAIPSPRQHRRRSFFRLHRNTSFLRRRVKELHEYLCNIREVASFSLNDSFLESNATNLSPLRWFSNFDSAFGQQKIVQLWNPMGSIYQTSENYNSEDSNSRSHYMEHASFGGGHLEMSLSPRRHLRPDRESIGDEIKLAKSAEDAVDGIQDLHRASCGSSIQSPSGRKSIPSTGNSKFQELSLNLADDRHWQVIQCLPQDQCRCQYASEKVAQQHLETSLDIHGFEIQYAPKEIIHTAFYCILYNLQQYNDIDQRIFFATTKSSGSTSSGPSSHDLNNQLEMATMILSETLANYGLLYAHLLHKSINLPLISLKKRLHLIKSKVKKRIGALELLLIATMLNLQIQIVANDHKNTVQTFRPLKGFPSLRTRALLSSQMSASISSSMSDKEESANAETIDISLGYLLPTMFNVHGSYVLLKEKGIETQLSTNEDASTEDEEKSLANSVGSVKRWSWTHQKKKKPLKWFGLDEMTSRLEEDVVNETNEFQFDVNSNNSVINTISVSAIGTYDSDERDRLQWIVQPSFYDKDIANALNSAILDAISEDCADDTEMFQVFKDQSDKFSSGALSPYNFLRFLEKLFGLDGAIYLVDFLIHVLPSGNMRKQLWIVRWQCQYAVIQKTKLRQLIDQFHPLA